MTPEARALKLLSPLYHAGADVEGWRVFTQALSDDLGGVAIAVTTDDKEWASPQELFWIGLATDRADLFQRYLASGLPWGEISSSVFFERFVATGALVSGERLAETAFYREWMQPQGLACEGPLTHAVNYSDGRRGWTMFIYRVEGRRVFDEDDLILCDLLVPHLATYANLFDALDGVQRERTALSEVVDRFLNGVFLVDVKRELLLSNLEARRILNADDGVRLDSGRLHFEVGEGNDDLGRCLGDAIGWRGRDSFGAGGEMSIERPSGKRAYVATIVPMNAAGPDSAFGNDVAVVLVADLEADQSAAADRVRRTCDLTATETELVRLMAEGLSLEMISRERGVAITTTRTHLRHIFAKTGTKSQSEVVKLLLFPAAQPSE